MYFPLFSKKIGTLIVYQANSSYILNKVSLSSAVFLISLLQGLFKNIFKNFAKLITKHLQKSFKIQALSRDTSICDTFILSAICDTSMPEVCYLRYKYARSSPPDVFLEEDTLKIYSKFTGDTHADV